jgi:hypothetical protein
VTLRQAAARLHPQPLRRLIFPVENKNARRRIGIRRLFREPVEQVEKSERGFPRPLAAKNQRHARRQGIVRHRLFAFRFFRVQFPRLQFERRNAPGQLHVA